MAGAEAEPTQQPQPITVLVAVRNTQGKPVPGARIEVKLGPISENDRDAAVPFQLQATDIGKAILMLPRSGLARITVTAPRYLTTEMDAVSLADGNEVTVEMERGGTLKGDVQDASGNAYSGVSVMVLKADDDEVGPRKLVELRPPVKTGPDGTFTMENLSSGFYTALLDREPGETPTVELEGRVPPAHVTEDHVEHTVVYVRPLGRIAGVVEFPLHDVPAVVLITPVPADRERLDEGYIKHQQVSVPTRGEPSVPFVLRGLSSGGYRLEFEAEGYAALLSSDEVFLPNGASVDFPPQFMDRGVEVEGTLRTREGDRPVPDTEVGIFFEGVDVPIALATSGEDGSLRFGKLFPGSYVARASTPGLLPLEEAVAVERDAEKASLDLRFRAGAVLEGVLIDNNDQPLPGVEVLLATPGVRGKPGRFSHMLTDAEGHFRFRGLPAGRYLLAAPALDLQQELSLGQDEKKTIVFDTRTASPLKTDPQRGQAY